MPGITDMRTDMRLQKPEVRVELDRDKAAGMGLDAAEIARAINVLIGSQEATIYKEGGHRYDVRVRVEEPAEHARATLVVADEEAEGPDGSERLWRLANRDRRPHAVQLDVRAPEGTTSHDGAAGPAARHAAKRP